jgi:uncharacterized membrane protein
MSSLIVISFPEEQLAFDMRAALAKLQKEYLIEMEDVVIVTKTEKGKVKLHQATNLTAAGAMSGAMTDLGINNQFMKDLAEHFKPGCSAIFVLVKKSTPDKVIERLAEFKGKGKILQTSLTKDEEDTLRAFIEAHPEVTPDANPAT